MRIVSKHTFRRTVYLNHPIRTQHHISMPVVSITDAKVLVRSCAMITSEGELYTNPTVGKQVLDAAAFKAFMQGREVFICSFGSRLNMRLCSLAFNRRLSFATLERAVAERVYVSQAMRIISPRIKWLAWITKQKIQIKARTAVAMALVSRLGIGSGMHTLPHDIMVAILKQV